MTPNQIKALRETRQWNQAELAARLGIDQATVSRIERGTIAPSGPVRLLLEVISAERASRKPATSQPERAL